MERLRNVTVLQMLLMCNISFLWIIEAMRLIARAKELHYVAIINIILYVVMRQ